METGEGSGSVAGQSRARSNQARAEKPPLDLGSEGGEGMGSEGQGVLWEEHRKMGTVGKGGCANSGTSLGPG